MPIVAICKNCGEEHSLKKEHAGRRIRCRDCGEPVKVPSGSGKKKRKKRRPVDDEDRDQPRRKKPRKSGGSGGGSGKLWMIIGGSVAGVLLLGGIVWFLFGGGGGWSPDSSIADDLTKEHNIGRYTVSASDAERVMFTRVSNSGGRDSGAIALVGSNGSFHLGFLKSDKFEGKTRAEVQIGGDGSPPVGNQADPVYSFPEGEVDYGSLDGIPFTRIRVDRSAARGRVRGPRVPGGGRYMSIYIGYDDGRRIEMVCTSNSAFDEKSFLTVDGIACTLKRKD